MKPGSLVEHKVPGRHFSDTACIAAICWDIFQYGSSSEEG